MSNKSFINSYGVWFSTQTAKAVLELGYAKVNRFNHEPADSARDERWAINWTSMRIYTIHSAIPRRYITLSQFKELMLIPSEAKQMYIDSMELTDVSPQSSLQ